MPIFNLAAAAAASILQPGSAVEQDVQCLVVFMQGDEVQSDDVSDEDKRQFVKMSYYLGKIEAETPGLDLVAAIKAVRASDLKMLDRFNAERVRCDREFSDSITELAKILE